MIADDLYRWCQLGNKALKQNQPLVAMMYFNQALQKYPQDFQLYSALGDTQIMLKKYSRAADYYQAALNLNPDFLQGYLNLSLALKHLGQIEAAIQCLESTLKLNHQMVQIYHRLGELWYDQGSLQHSAHYCEMALQIDKNYLPSWKFLAFIQLKQFNYYKAQQYFIIYLFLDKGYPLNWEHKPAFDFTKKPNDSISVNLHKLSHDIEQLSYLVEKKLLPESYASVIEVYKTLRDNFSQHTLATLSAEQEKVIKETYKRNLYIQQSLTYSAPLINPHLDYETIQQTYLSSQPEVTYFDQFLTPDTLNALRTFCLNSTIWHDDDKKGRYLGTYSYSGFNHPLIYQIAQELQNKLPQIFSQLFLSQFWAFKYDSDYLEGIDIHADEAAVNVNFWITPDEANLDPHTGGLVVYTKEAPQEWDFQSYNINSNKIEGFIQNSQAEKIVIPYRCNRVVMFNSNLFHATDNFKFKSGYTNRRINITMLFGERKFKPLNDTTQSAFANP